MLNFLNLSTFQAYINVLVDNAAEQELKNC